MNRSPSARIHHLSDLPDDAADLAVVAADRAEDIVACLRSPGREAPAGVPLVALVRLATLNGPDTVALFHAAVDGTRFTFTVEHRRFEGVLGANVPSTAVLEASLGALSAGDYEILITTRVLGFDQPERPGDAQPREDTSRSYGFAVA